MEATTCSLDTEKEALLKEGFLDLGDSEMGEHVWKFEQEKFPFYTEAGLDFLQKHILGNPVIRSIVEWFFGSNRCILAHCLRYGALPGHIECFLTGGQEAGQRALMVNLLAKGSRVDFYAYSHLHKLPTEESRRSTHELSRTVLQKAGCEVREKNFNVGGSVIVDARLGREFCAGYTITAIFLTEELVIGLPKMTLPSLPRLREKVSGMQSEKIRINFEFEDAPESTGA